MTPELPGKPEAVNHVMPIVGYRQRLQTQRSRIFAAAHKFGWLQASWKGLKEKEFWLRGLGLN
jgi:hypothetical protein